MKKTLKRLCLLTALLFTRCSMTGCVSLLLGMAEGIVEELAGTEATPAIFGFAAACEEVYPTFRQDISREKELLNRLCEELCKLDGVVINGANDAPHILNLSIPGVPTQNSLNLLQDKGICVSAGSACAKGHRSHTLKAMKLDPKIIDSSFRISLCRDTTEEEVNAFLEGVQSILDWKNR